MKNLSKKGFTIVELVIVIAVIAILAAVLIPTFNSVINKANESSAMQEGKAALEVVTLAEGGDMSTATYYFVCYDKAATDAAAKVKYVFKYDSDETTPFANTGWSNKLTLVESVAATATTPAEYKISEDTTEKISGIVKVALDADAQKDISSKVVVYKKSK